MPHIAIISSSVRTGRNSHRVSLYFKNFIEAYGFTSAEIIDLKEYNFPLFDERLQHLPDPTPLMLDYASRIKAADGVLIVTPEYNGGYPASIKNATDFLYDEWHRKPIAIATVSDGDFGGTQVITSLQFSLWKIRAWTIPARFTVQNVEEAFDENGIPANQKLTDSRAKVFIDELLWCMEAKSRMKDYVSPTHPKK